MDIKTTMNKVLHDIGSQKRYAEKDVMELLQIDATGLRKLEQEGKLQKLGPTEMGRGLYHPSHVLRLLGKR